MARGEDGCVRDLEYVFRRSVKYYLKGEVTANMYGYEGVIRGYYFRGKPVSRDEVEASEKKMEQEVRMRFKKR